ncbi:MAG: hypothetical protein ACW96X_01375 [Promethearchaeota archaeon]|jgi:hypothetical protein
MRKINNDQQKKIKNFIFRYGRLLERKLYSCCFENGNKEDVIKALLTYQNYDGGFGNGIEPDLLVPDSTAIGAETAMFYLDLLGDVDNKITDQLFDWIIQVQNEEGYISHPPENMYNYPFQKWWDGPDKLRIFTLAGYCKKWGIKDISFFKKVKNYYSNTTPPEEYTLYEYPYFVYLKYFSESKEEKNKFQQIVNQLPSIFEKNKEHYLLFGRHWYLSLDHVDKKVMDSEITNFFNGLQDDGGLKIIYQDLPWWRPIWTLDALIILKMSGMTNL